MIDVAFLRRFDSVCGAILSSHVYDAEIMAKLVAGA